MRKNRTILFALLIPLLLDLLVFFTSAAPRHRSESSRFKQRSEEVVEAGQEIGEELEEEEETEFLHAALPPGASRLFRPDLCSKRCFFTPSEFVALQPFGWSMPLLI